MKRRIFINASTVLISGGLIVARNIIKALSENQNYELLIVCPSYTAYKNLVTSNSKLVVVPHALLSRWLRFYHDTFWLPKLIKNFNAEVVLSLGNLPAKTSVKQIFLHDNPYLTENDYSNIPLPLKIYLIHKLRNSLTLKRLSKVSVIVTQTNYQKTKLEKIMHYKRNVKVLSPNISFDLPIPKTQSHKNKPISYNILCLSRYYEHKNIEILLRVASLIKERKLPIKIYITISSKHHPRVIKLLTKIKESELEGILINHGRIRHNKINPIIEDSDAILIPSLLESFSLSYIEAWHFKKPLFVSDIQSNRSACKDAAVYFNPHSAKNILDSFLAAITKTEKIDALITKGSEQLRALPAWNEYSSLINSLIE